MTNHFPSRLKPWRFDNRFVQTLPGDPKNGNRRRQVKNACYSLVQPTPASAPKLIACSAEMLRELDLDAQDIDTDALAQVLSGNQLLPQMQPFAMCYGGHQFGHWAGQLGDGRAINLGDVINQAGKRWSLQLKGAGPTPYSRTADGYAVLRSSLREFLCSEAMFHLGVPTTRALSLVLTGDEAVRDMLYDGHPAYEPTAIVCRVAPSFIRFGNFQILAQQHDLDTLKKLADYCIATDFPQLDATAEDIYLQWFREITTRTADMIVHWMRVGFVHGVMNTDNMSILGLTIDYGPYGWLEDYDADWTPNTTDAGGRRYRFANQSNIALWNLLQLAEAIYPLVEQTGPLEETLQYFNDYYLRQYNKMMAQKLGFQASSGALEKRVADLLQLLQRAETDFTLFYRALSELDLQRDDWLDDDVLKRVFGACWYVDAQIDEDYLKALKSWLQDYNNDLISQNIGQQTRCTRMNQINPKYVLRNYLAQQAIDKATQGDYSMIDELLDVLRKPYDEQPERENFALKRPEWARHRAGCSMLSCSS